MRPNRQIVPLRNFNPDEFLCKCGRCNKSTDPELMVRLQAFIYIVEREFKAPVRCWIDGPARCIPHNINVYKRLGVTEYRESYHVGMSRGRGGIEDQCGAAVDVRIEIHTGKDWVRIAKERIAELAIESKLFGGVGWKIYGPASVFTHLDLGPVREF